jgi:hypothetical protein
MAIRRGLALLGLLVGLLFGGQTMAAPPGNGVAAVISMAPSAGYVGDLVTLVCSNIRAPLRIDFNGMAADVASIKTNANGDLDVRTIVPARAKTGPVHISSIASVVSLNAGTFTVLGGARVSIPLMPTDPVCGSPIGGRPATGPPYGGLPGAPRPSGPATFDPDLDLPIEAPQLVSKTPTKAPLPPKPVTPPPIPELPPTIYGKDLKSETGSIIYVIDISGSMGWDIGRYITADGKVATGCRLDRAKAELTRSVKSLPKSFKFNIESYDCLRYVCFVDYSNSHMPLLPADEDHKKKAIDWIQALQPQGATGTGPAVLDALATRENRLIVLLTDGRPNCGSRDEDGSWNCMMGHLSQIDCGNEQRATIDVFGIGATGEFKQFCQDVSSHNGGSYTDVR